VAFAGADTKAALAPPEALDTVKMPVKTPPTRAEAGLITKVELRVAGVWTSTLLELVTAVVSVTLLLLSQPFPCAPTVTVPAASAE